MPPPTPNKHILRKQTLEQCERVGIDGIRNAILRGAFQGEALPIAKQWLKNAERGHTEQSDLAQREIDRGIARQANRNAVWLGIASLLISLGALAVSIYALAR